MPTVQGEFPSEDAAQQAMMSLQEAGVAAGRMRRWNIIPPSTPSPGNPDAVVGGAMKGAAIGGTVGAISGAWAGGGLAGLVAGAAAGGAYDGGERHMLEPSGVRVVVDTEDTGPDAPDAAEVPNVAELLRAAGATNVQSIPGE